MTRQVLTTNDVAIKQVTIEVKVLKIGNRQVTQAVFKQLPYRSIIDPKTYTLRGIPWGRVNYHVECTEYSGKHLHIVWQSGNQLYRAYERHPSESKTEEWVNGSYEGIKWMETYTQLQQLDQLFIAV